MELINVNQSKCIKCGICSKVCPCAVLSMTENGPTAVTSENNCIGCGHCVAACPNGALDNVKSPSSNQVNSDNIPVMDSKTAQYFLRSRRSVRCYKDTPVPKEKLLELVNIAHYAPTASNSQGISYVIVDNKEILKKATEVIIEWMEQQLDNPYHWSFPRHVKNYRDTGIDSILRSAPHIILATAPKNFRNGRENTLFSFSYLELYAPTIGLGSCFAGLFEMCAFSGYSPLLELFNIPKDKVITGAVMVGYPKYKYKNIVDRNPLDVNYIE